MPESQTDVNLKDRIVKCLREYGIEKAVVATVADNCSNMVNALQRLVVPRLDCFAHTLQLSIKVGLKEPRVTTVRVASKHLVKRFKKSNKAATHLRQLQTEEGLRAYRLILEVEARRNSTYSMFQRLVELEWTVKRVLCNPDVVALSDAQHLDMTEANQTVMKQLLLLLHPMKMITDMLQATNCPTIA